MDIITQGLIKLRDSLAAYAAEKKIEAPQPQPAAQSMDWEGAGILFDADLTEQLIGTHEHMRGEQIHTAIERSPKSIAALQLALSQLGINSEHTAAEFTRVKDYFAATRYDGKIEITTPWCAAFACWVLEHVGIDTPQSAHARDLLRCGTPVATPITGDLVIYWRGDPNGPDGHVGFYIAHNGQFVATLGGNQDGSVSIKMYNRAQVLGYRRF